MQNQTSNNNNSGILSHHNSNVRVANLVKDQPHHLRTEQSLLTDGSVQNLVSNTIETGHASTTKAKQALASNTYGTRPESGKKRSSFLMNS